ncbi:hypothetical protein ACF08M_37710 [Streptomyces sp. NPDC015032]|uniref:hypothetical protein n=1 Tax=Streptomyces sp. NPDC015032 TaxID=3364937 RepID=UPI0036F895CB
MAAVPVPGGDNEHIHRGSEHSIGHSAWRIDTEREVIEVHRQPDATGLQVPVGQHLLSRPVEDSHPPTDRLHAQLLRQSHPRCPGLLSHDSGAGCGSFLAAGTHPDVQRSVRQRRNHHSR